jgi:hypothetical protein
MLEESSHSVSTNSQKSKKKSIKKTATAFFSKFYSSKNHHDAPVQRDVPKKLYSENDFFLKKKRETDRVSANPIDLKRASSSINIITLSQLNDLDKENLKEPATESYFRVQDIEPNSREKSPSKHLPFRRPVTRLVHLSDISCHSDSHINTLDHYRKRPTRVAPFTPLYDVMFQDDPLDPGNDTNREKSTSAPSSTLSMNMEPDHRILGMDSECCESPTGFSSLERCVTPSHKQKDSLSKNDIYSGPNLSSGAKQDAWLDVSLRPPKTRPKSKSANINHNKKPQLVQRWSSSGSSTPSVEYENRNIHKTSEKPPINRTNSTKSTLSISSNVSTRSVFRRSESHKKESKAIVLWQTTVEKLIEKSERINTIGTKFHVRHSSLYPNQKKKNINKSLYRARIK